MTRASGGSAKQWALKALARRMHTTREMERGLSRRGWSRATIEDVLGYLGELGYLDDAKFAEAWVTDRSRLKLHGPMRLLKDLQARGVEEETARAAIQRFLPRSREMELARCAAERKRQTIRESGIRAVAAMHRHLRSRGFSGDVIRTVMSEIPFEEDDY
ncbi:MAG: regulatory protein RecX [Proteobacteria bacterium]|nr:regulatory protein RecX [Pseudomonadota bacterium]